MIDFDNLWNSEKLASCKSATRAEYLWVYGLADANGSFELNMRAIHAKVSAIRPRLTLQRLKHIFAELEAHGLMFTWQENGKTYAHWTKSEAPGRLPPAKERYRYKSFAPPVPITALAEYESRGYRECIATTSPIGVGAGLGLDRIGKGDGEVAGKGVGVGGETPAVSGHTNGNQSVAIPQTPNRPVYEKTENIKTNTSPNGKAFYCRWCDGSFETSKHVCQAKTRAGWECRGCHETLPLFADLKNHSRACSQARATR